MLLVIKSFFGKVKIALTASPSFIFTACLYCIISVQVAYLGACGSSVKPRNNDKDSLPVIQLPPSTPISKDFAGRLNYCCARWFDSALKRKGFNGGIIVAKNGNIVFEKYN